MKRKTLKPAGASPVPSRSRGLGRKIWQIVAALACLSAVGFGGWQAWRWITLPARLQAALPPVPNLDERPAILRERLVAAQTLVAGRSTVFEGLAEFGRLYHANGFWAEAEACWRVLQRAQPNEPRWSYYLADVRRLSSDYDEVTRLLIRTAELAPDYAPVLLQIADLAFKQGKLEMAARYYRERRVRLPKDPYAGLGLARIAIAQKHPDEAVRLLAQICVDVPHFPSSHNLYAEILAAKGDQKAASRHRWLGREA